MPILSLQEAIEAVESIISFIEANTTPAEISNETLQAGRDFLYKLESEPKDE